MYEEYLEDYFYKLMAKIMTRIRSMFKSKKVPKASETSLLPKDTLSTGESAIETPKSIEDKKDVIAIKDVSTKEDKTISDKISDNKVVALKDTTKKTKGDLNKEKSLQKCEKKTDKNGDDGKSNNASNDVDEELNNLNFHMTMFFLWMCVTLVNVPALMTWAKNFK